MAVVTTSNGNYITFSGTLAEVVGALASNHINEGRVLGFLYDGTNYVVLVSK